MADDTAALVLSLEARFDKFEKAMQDVGRVVDKQTKSIEDRFTTLTKVVNSQLQSLSGAMIANLGTFGQLLVALGPAGTAAAIGLGTAVAVINAMTEAAEKAGTKAIDLINFANATGLTVKETKAFAAVARQVGIAPDEAARSIEILTAAIASLREGSGPLVDVLRRYKPELIGILTSSAPLPDRMIAFAEALRGVDTETRNLILRSAGGRAAIDTLGRVFGQADLAAKFGKALEGASDGETRSLAELQLSINALRIERSKMIDEMRGNAVVLENEKRVLEDINNVIKAYKTGGVTGALSQFFKDAAIDLGLTADNTKATAAAQAKLNEQYADATDRLSVLKQQQGFLTESYDLSKQAIVDLAAKSKVAGDSYDQFSKQASKDADSYARQLARVNSQIDDQQTKLDELAKTATPPTAKITVTPDSTGKRKAVELLETEPTVRFLGGAATATERLTVEQLKLGAAVEGNRRLLPELNRALDFAAEQDRAATVAVRERLGVAKESEIQAVKTAEVERAISTQRVEAIDKERAMTVAAKEARERYEAVLVRSSSLPNLTRMALDAQNLAKTFDAFAVTSINTFVDSMADAVTHTKTLSQAFTDMTQSILKDLARILIRRALLSLITPFLGVGASSSFPGVGSSPFAARMAGGPVAGGKPFIVGEGGPELFVPNQSGFIVPNSAMRGGAPGGLSFGDFNIDARGAAPGVGEDIMRRMRAEMPGIAITAVATAQRYGALRSPR